MENHTYVSEFPKQNILKFPKFRILTLSETTYENNTIIYIFKKLSSSTAKKCKHIFVADALATNLKLFCSIEKTENEKPLTRATATIIADDGSIIATHVEVPYEIGKQFANKKKYEFPCLVVIKSNKIKLYCLPKK